MSKKVRVCPECNRQNDKDSWNCANCGETLPFSSITETPESNAPKPSESLDSGLESSKTEEARRPRASEERARVEKVHSPDVIYCSSCGQSSPAQANFCWRCGQSLRIGIEDDTEKRERESNPSASWEYRDFVYDFPRREFFAPVGTEEGSFTPEKLRLETWQAYQSDVFEELQALLDEGWEPIGEIGPACIKLDFYQEDYFSSSNRLSKFGQVITGTFLLSPFIKVDYAAAEKFQLKLRRRT